MFKLLNVISDIIFWAAVLFGAVVINVVVANEFVHPFFFDLLGYTPETGKYEIGAKLATAVTLLLVNASTLAIAVNAYGDNDD